MWVTLLFAGTAVLFLGMAATACWHLRWVRRLPPLERLTCPSSGSSETTKPEGARCSVIVAARDEEARIEQTVQHLLAQRDVELEVILVDDRSTDRTGAILQSLAKSEPRLQVRRVDSLPDGWLGKCHACHLGAGAAGGDWILFTDADCWLKPDALARAIRLAERDGVDHVTLSPGPLLEWSGARAWYLLFLTSLLGWIAGANRDRPRSFVGIGAFNLVRTTVYRRCGGYEALRLTVLDDMKLGLLMRRAGGKTRAFLGADDVECHWGSSIGSMVKVMEKNYFAALDYRVGLVWAGVIAVLVMGGVVLAGLLSGTASGIAAALSPLAGIIPATVLSRRVGWSWPCAVLVPFMFPVYLYALLNSTRVTLRQEGVWWRETFYPLATLRAGNVR
jgi:glycosyltransferase involved in cell wall biosynthesis